MKLARLGAAPADDDYGMPTSSRHAPMTMDALREELLNESIRQSVIAAELAERRDLEAGFQHDVPVRIRTGFRTSTALPLRDASPVPAHSGSSIPRRSVKDRIEAWSRPPWHITGDEDDASFHRERSTARLRPNALSGVKRKRTPEPSWWICSICEAKCARESDVQSHLRGRRHQANIEALRSKLKIEAKPSEEKGPQLAEKNLKPMSGWKCTICKASCTSESDLESHLRGRRHQENIYAMRSERKIEAKPSEEKATWLAEKNMKSVSTWKCTICKSDYSSESDLESHLRGRRHQENIEALWSEQKIKAKLSEEKWPWLAEKNMKSVSAWKCTICKSNYSSESDLESHLRGRRHQENIEALWSEGKIKAKLSEEKAPLLAQMNLKPVSRWKCAICKSNYSSKSDLETHLRGRRHQENIEAPRSKRKIEAEQFEEKAPQLAEANLKPVSRWKCTICKANCTSESDLESHLRGRRHQDNIEALRSERKIDAKQFEEKAPQLHEKNLKPVLRWKCTICNANCTSESDLESHLRGRRHQLNVQAQC